MGEFHPMKSNKILGKKYVNILCSVRDPRNSITLILGGKHRPMQKSNARCTFSITYWFIFAIKLQNILQLYFQLHL